jgi:hypothetical protein
VERRAATRAIRIRQPCCWLVTPRRSSARLGTIHERGHSGRHVVSVAAEIVHPEAAVRITPDIQRFEPSLQVRRPSAEAFRRSDTRAGSTGTRLDRCCERRHPDAAIIVTDRHISSASRCDRRAFLWRRYSRKTRTGAGTSGPKTSAISPPNFIFNPTTNTSTLFTLTLLFLTYNFNSPHYPSPSPSYPPI